MSIIVRVRGKAGTHRYTVDKNDTIANLHKLISEKINVPAEELTLRDTPSKEGKSLSPSSTLVALNIAHGHMLYVSYESKDAPDNTKPFIKKTKTKSMTMESFLEEQEKNKLKIEPQIKSNVNVINMCPMYTKHFCSYLKKIDYNYTTAFLIGNKTKTTKVENPEALDIKCVAIYESDKMSSNMEQFLDLFEYKVVGRIIGHNGARYFKNDSTSTAKLSNKEVLETAALQEKYGENFTTVLAYPLKNGKLSLEAFHVSNQAVELVKKKSLICKGDSIKVEHEHDVVVLKQSIKDKGSLCDPILFECNVGIAFLAKSDIIFSPGFDSKRREPYTIEKCREYFERYRSYKFIEKIADIHLLEALSETLPMSFTQDFPKLCEAIKTKNNNMCGAFEHLVHGLLGIM